MRIRYTMPRPNKTPADPPSMMEVCLEGEKSRETCPHEYIETKLAVSRAEARRYARRPWGKVPTYARCFDCGLAAQDKETLEREAARRLSDRHEEDEDG